MIIRLLKGMKELKYEDLNGYWQSRHKAFCLIKRVTNPEGLASYISDQRKRKGMSVEMSSQEQIIRWRMGTGWVPVGFMKAFGKFWFETGSNLDDPFRTEVVRDWIIDAWKNIESVNKRPYLDGNTVRWSSENV
jgi:hypothetical protein